ncbi:hypothetical protein [Streptomyces sp. 150FB]|uniref:hypothetical protein n=1 Tax=Streptomyces sp. 150FB TaxID=1576605 RepID=UPI00069901F7|nr:hypothetical protein [Streptomyces sp. 150FB]
MNLRMLGLAAVVVFTALVPLAASAGPVSVYDGTKPSGTTDGTAATAVHAPTTAKPAKAPGPAASGATSELCGPDVTSPEGVEAQTCVLTGRAGGSDRTWARTYYRNATGAELLAVLSLMGPGGRTVQTHCAVAATGEPAACETRREASRGAAAQYMAVAEFAPAAEADTGRLLLRAGSAPAPDSALNSDPKPGASTGR